MSLKVRIAPSPTGDPHVGTGYIGLFNYAFAKKNGGKFILRIEDTDRKRSTALSEQQIFDALHWLGLNYDEGPDVGGDFGPYRQSERYDIYKEYALKLIEKGEAYYAFETEEELDAMRKRQKALGQPPMYDRKARKLTKEEIQEKLDNNVPYVIRLKMPYEGQTIIKDELRGEIAFDNDKIDDQILLKADGYPTYHLANIVDDHLMGITHIIRAEEWITSTPKHFQLYKAFGWEVPKFYHMPLLRNPDRSKISKRKVDTSLNNYREAGYLKEAILNFLALMGWSMPPDENGVSKEIFTLEEMVENFDFNRISLGGPIFDLVKLDWINNQYMRKKDLKELTEMCIPYFEKEKYDLSIYNNEELEKIVDILRESATTLHNLAINAKEFFDDEVVLQVENEDMNRKERQSLKKMHTALTHQKSKEIIEIFIEKINKLGDNNFKEDNISSILKEIMEITNESPAIVLMNIRGKITGKPRGIDLNSLITILGKERVLNRIENNK